MKFIYLSFSLLLLLASCSKGAFKKAEGHFTANGTTYAAEEDMMSAGYGNTSKILDVSIGGGPSSTYNASVRLDLNHIDTTIKIPLGAEGFIYYGANSAVQYLPVSGEYKITSHSAGNPATQHTEGTFNYVVVNQYNSADTIKITDGYFYVNNY